MVHDYESYKRAVIEWPDPGDIHVVAAALKTKASLIVSDDQKGFPEDGLAEHEIGIRNADQFIADTICLKPDETLKAIKQMRARYQRPEYTADKLRSLMDQRGLAETAALLADKAALF